MNKSNPSAISIIMFYNYATGKQAKLAFSKTLRHCNSIIYDGSDYVMLEFDLTGINSRVIKTTKGGRRFKFSALVVVGDGNGRVGYGIGKSIEVPEAIKKATRVARRNLVNVKVVGNQDTVPDTRSRRKDALTRYNVKMYNKRINNVSARRF